MNMKDTIEEEILEEHDDEYINDEFLDISDLGLDQLYISIDEEKIDQELDRNKL